MVAPASSRRGLILGLAALPLAGGVAVSAPSERADYRARLLDAFAEDRGVRPIVNTAKFNSREDIAGTLVMCRLWDTCSEIADLPAPKTMDGLGLLALATALLWEGDSPSDKMAEAVLSLVRATIALTSTTIPAEWIGFGDEHGWQERDKALCRGDGVMPAWALAEAEASESA